MVLAIDDVFVVQVLECEYDLCRVKLSSESGKTYCSSESRCFLESSPKSSPPGQYSNAKKSFF